MSSRRLRLILLASAFTLPAGLAAAASFDIVAGTNTTNQTLTGNETGVVESGATLAPTGVPVTVNGTATGVSLTNSGTIQSADGGRGVDIATGSGAVTVTVTNKAGANLVSTSSDAIRLSQSTTSGAITVSNAGAIRSNGAEQAIDFRADTKGGASFEIDNLAGGRIRSNGAEAIGAREGVINNAAGASIIGGTSGIVIDDGAGGAGTGATKLTNDGTISGLNGSGVVMVGSFNDTVVNTGAINATGGIALSTGKGADNVTSSGVISSPGGTAIDLGGGVDTLTLQTSSTTTGLIDGGSEFDTLNLEQIGADANGSLGSTANFEVLNVNSGAWRLSGAQSYTNGVSLRNGADLTNNADLRSTNDSTVKLADTSPDRVVITNNASISNSQSDGRAINILPPAAVENVTINNNAGAEIMSQSDAIRLGVSPAGGRITVNNSGTIRSTGNGALSTGGRAIDFSLAAGGTIIQINNQASGSILSVGADAIRPGQGATVTNAGLIRSDINTAVGYADIDGIDWQGRTGTVVNQATGVISGVRRGVTGGDKLDVTNQAGGAIIGRNGSGLSSGGTGAVVNFGTITGAIDLSYTSGDGLNGNGDGVDIAGLATIDNSGTIQGTGARGVDSGGLANTSEGIRAGGGSITNRAGGVISGVNNGILVDDGAGGPALGRTTLVNAGTIRGLNGSGVALVGAIDDTVTNTGTISAIGGAALSTGLGDDSVTSSGAISASGGSAIDLGGGFDTLTLQTGSVTTGLIDGGTERDALILQQTGAIANGAVGSTANFESLDIQSGSWTLSGTQNYANGANVRDGVVLTNNATLTSTQDTTLKLADPSTVGIVINNNGTISNSLTDGRAINIFPASVAQAIVINNAAGAVISSQDDAIRLGINPAGGAITLNNAGTIRSTGNGALSNGGQAVNFDLSSGSTALQINNLAGGQILSVGQDAIRPGQGTVVTNAGLIRSDINTAVGYARIDGIDWQNRTGTVDNQATGVISGVRHGITAANKVNVINEAGGVIIARNGSGVGSDGNGTVVNAGTITGAVDMSYTSGDGLNGDGDGVDIDGLATIDNSGIIQGTGARGVDSGGRANASEGIAAGGGTITNRLGGVISGANSGILVDDGAGGAGVGATTLVNDGIIRGLNGSGVTLVGVLDDTITNTGTISAAGGAALSTGDGADVVTNSGTIAATGGSAIDMGAGNDSLVLKAGSAITGLIDGGAGTDAIALQINGGVTAGALSSTANFETLDIQSGTWTLTGTQAYGGGTTIRNGAIAAVNGTLGGAINVQAGGRLKGSGTLGAVTVRGAIAPGNSIGVTNVGSVTFTNTGVYEVEVNATQSDLIAATGAATLAGTVQVLTQAGVTYGPVNTYTILTAGGITGAFSAVTSNLAFLTPDLVYSPTEVDLVLRRNDVQFTDIATSPNQRRVGAAITAAGVANPLYQALLPLSAADAASSLDLLSGDLHPSALYATLELSQEARGTLLGRLSQDRTGAWITVFDRGGTTDAEGGRAKAEQSRGGVSFGGDLATGGWRLGIEAGLSNGELKLPGRAAKADMDGAQFGVYGGTEVNGYHVKLGWVTGGYDLKTTRNLLTATLTQTLSASYTAHASQVFGEVGMGAGPLQPFAGLALSRVKAEDFTETGGSAAVMSGQRDENLAYSTLGARYRGIVGVAAIHGEAAWRHGFNTDASSTLSFVGGGPAFTVDGAKQDADVGLFKLGLDFGAGGPARISLDGNLQAGGGSKAYGVSASFDWKF